MRLRLIVAALAAAPGLVVLATACGGNGDQPGDSGTPTATATATASTSPAADASGSPTPLSLVDWAERVCALSVEAADTLDVPGPENPETLTLERHRQWVTDVVEPRVAALEGTVEELAGIERHGWPWEFSEASGTFMNFNQVLQREMNDIAVTWRHVVFAAESGQSQEEINNANELFVRVQNESFDFLESWYYDNWVVSDEIRAALSQPQDCGILNEIRSRGAPTPPLSTTSAERRPPVGLRPVRYATAAAAAPPIDTRLAPGAQSRQRTGLDWSDCYEAQTHRRGSCRRTRPGGTRHSLRRER